MKQKGQGIIEFALIVPLLVAVGVAVVYVGIMFLDYTQYSNAARDAARDISVQTEVTYADESYKTAAQFRKEIVAAINAKTGDAHEAIVERYAHPYTNIFTSEWTATFYKLNPSTGKLQSGTDKDGKTINENNCDTIEVTIALKLADDVEGDDQYLGKWFANLFNLPPIRYKMVLE